MTGGWHTTSGAQGDAHQVVLPGEPQTLRCWRWGGAARAKGRVGFKDDLEQTRTTWVILRKFLVQKKCVLPWFDPKGPNETLRVF